MQFGTAFHKALEYDLIRKTCLEDKKLHQEKQVIEMKRIFLENFKKSMFLPEEEKKYEELVVTGMKMIEMYFRELPRLEELYGIKTGESEVWLKASLKDPFTGEELPILTIGIADRISSEEIILEFKTSAGKWDEKDIKTKWQTIFYGWFHWQMKGRHPKKIVYLIFTKQKTPQLQIIETNYLQEDYAKLFQECKNIINKVELGIFDRPEGFHQNFCDCYKFEEALKI